MKKFFILAAAFLGFFISAKELFAWSSVQVQPSHSMVCGNGKGIVTIQVRDGQGTPSKFVLVETKVTYPDGTSAQFFSSTNVLGQVVLSYPVKGGPGKIAIESKTQAPGFGNASVDVFQVKPVSVDAKEPEIAAVNYQVEPSSTVLSSAVFSISGASQTKTNLSGGFAFNFNQRLLPRGTTTMSLTVQSGGVSCSVENVTAVRSTKSSSNTGSYFVLVPVEISNGRGILVPMPIIHRLYENYEAIDYSVPTMNGSKTIHAGQSVVSITIFDPGADIPSEIEYWRENHLYRDGDGPHNRVEMTSFFGITLPRQTPHSQSKAAMLDKYFKSNNSLKGVGIFREIVFQSIGNGLVSPMPTPWSREITSDLS